MLGIRKETLKTYKRQFKQRNKVLNSALKELADKYGIRLVRFHVDSNG